MEKLKSIVRDLSLRSWIGIIIGAIILLVGGYCYCTDKPKGGSGSGGGNSTDHGGNGGDKNQGSGGGDNGGTHIGKYDFIFLKDINLSDDQHFAFGHPFPKGVYLYKPQSTEGKKGSLIRVDPCDREKRTRPAPDRHNFARIRKEKGDKIVENQTNTMFYVASEFDHDYMQCFKSCSKATPDTSPWFLKGDHYRYLLERCYVSEAGDFFYQFRRESDSDIRYVKVEDFLRANKHFGRDMSKRAKRRRLAARLLRETARARALPSP